MIGYEAITKDRKIQINDRLETMCVIREVRPDEEYEVKEGTSNYVIVHALKKKWYVAPISHVTIPAHGVGLEIFNADGRCMFSSSVRLVPFVSWYDVNMNTAGRGQITVRGKAGHRYGYIPLRSMGYIWNRNKQSYINPTTFDEVWEWDVYSERYELTNDVGGLTFKYAYDMTGRMDGYTSPPSDREGSGLIQQGWMIDVSMLES